MRGIIRLIDATLSVLDGDALSAEAIFRFIGFIRQIGINDLQISPAVYNRLAGRLPPEVRYYLELDTGAYLTQNYIQEYPGVEKFIVPRHGESDQVIGSYQINDMREISNLKSIVKGAQARLTGFDDLMNHDYEAVFERIRQELSAMSVIFCPENTYHCATAIAVLYLQNKGTTVMTTMTGIGNKAATEQVLLAMRVTERFKPNQSFMALARLREWLETETEIRISKISPVIGERIFYIESGLHVDGIMKKPANYEAYPPELVGAKRKIILGKHSGKTSVRMHMQGSGRPEAQDALVTAVLSRVKKKSTSLGRGLTDEEFLEIIKEADADEKDD